MNNIFKSSLKKPKSKKEFLNFYLKKFVYKAFKRKTLIINFLEKKKKKNLKMKAFLLAFLFFTAIFAQTDPIYEADFTKFTDEFALF